MQQITLRGLVPLLAVALIFSFSFVVRAQETTPVVEAPVVEEAVVEAPAEAAPAEEAVVDLPAQTGEAPVVEETETAVVDLPAQAGEAPVVEETSTETVVEEILEEVLPAVLGTDTEKEFTPAEEEVVAEETLDSTNSPQAELSTDKDDYHPGETATIFGKFFSSLENLVVKIFGSDDNNENYTETLVDVTTDESGEFNTDYTLDDLYRPFYEVIAFDTDGNKLAETWFRDAAIGGYDQCANDGNNDGTAGDEPCNWVNGALNPNNSIYQEGDATVQRLWLKGFEPEALHTITLQYGTTKGGKHAYDFLTTWNHSENWIDESDRCEGIDNCVGVGDVIFPFQTDPSANNFDVALDPRYMTMRGGSISAITAPVIESGSYAGDSETIITVSFEVDPEGSDMCTSKQQGQNTVWSCDVVFWFGAHIADEDNWGPGTGAGSIDGSPYHVALSKLDGDSVGNRDNQMQANTIIVPEEGNIVVVKQTIPDGDSQSFNFNASYDNDGFSLADNDQNDSGLLTAGNYTVSETVPAGWTQTSATCVSSLGEQEVETVANLELDPEETITCTFTNTKQAHLIVDKITDPSGDSQSFDFTTDAGSNFSLTDAAAPHDSGAIAPGTYSVSETVPAGWDLTSATCSDASPINAVVLSAGETVTCTFTNTQRGHVVIVKNVIGNPDPTDFTFQNNFGNGNPSTFMLDEDANGTLPSSRNFEVLPGVFTVSEDALAGWQMESATCDQGETIGSIDVAAGETVTCTFVNEELISITLVKNTVGGDGAFGFTMTGAGLPANTTLTTVAGTDSEVFTGLDQDNVFSFDETTPAGWVETSASCDNGDPVTSVTPDPGENVTCTFTNTKNGKIIIEKQTLPDGSSETFDFTGEIIDTLGDGETAEQEVVPGTYFVAESVPAGWNITDISCDDGDSSGLLAEAEATFNVDAGETVTCVFTNTQKGHIIVDKVTNPTGDTHEFNFDAEGTGYEDFNLTDAANPNDQELIPGSYNVIEFVPPGWDLEGISCVSSLDDPEDTDGLALDLDPGETITCTFTNEKDANIIVQKQTLPDEDTTDFTFDASYDLDGFTLSDGEQDDSGDLDPGTYSVSEDALAGWYLADTTCTSSNDDQETAVSISLEAGETVTCVFTNVEIQDLTVEKTADTTFTRTFEWTIDKSVTPATWELFKGDTGTSEYTIAVTKDDGEDSDWAVSGTITIENPNTNPALVAIIESVDDVVTNSGIMDVDCGDATFPDYELAAGETLECTYSGDLTDGEEDTNTATVSVTENSLVPGGEGTADVTFGDPEVVVNDEINVDDTNGDSWLFTDDDSETYSRTFTCDADEGVHDNTATIVETDQSDDASVTVNCYDLTVTKDAETSLDRTWEWDIEKTGSEDTLTLSPGQTHQVDYEVTVSVLGSENSNWAVEGEITISNPNPTLDADLTDVVDELTDALEATVTCPDTTVLAGADLVCTYERALPDAENRTNTATATLQNNDYDKDGVGTPSGTTDYSGNADVDFADADVNEIDECITVDDTNPLGPQDQVVCEDDSPKVFNYSVDVGPYEQEACGTTVDVDNTATFVTNDTETEGSDDHNVDVTIACVCSLTQGYWKTHNDSFHGGAPTDDNWENINDAPIWGDGNTVDEDELEGFFKSNSTWFGVFWTAPKGNVYYNMAHQYMAAKLNVLNGAWNPTIGNALAQAEALLLAKTPAQTKNLKGAEKNTWNNLASTFGAFNEGPTNPAGHCSEIPL